MKRAAAPGDAVLVAIEDGIMTATLNVPQMRNAISAPGMREGLTAAVDRFFEDDGLSVLILTGAGGAFSSGGNLNRLKEMDAATLRRTIENGSWLYRRIILGEKPVLAAVEGAAFGAGLGLAIACDTVVAARDARFCASFVRIGGFPDAALFWSLPWRVGPARARQLMMFGEEVGGEEAVRIGLADRLAEPGHALAEARRLAKALADGPPLAIGRIKGAIRQAPMSLEAALQLQLDNAPQLFSSEDFREGAAAFLEKRKPRFRGR
ncbi:MAG: enoyl-CoA hydratase/isomerase family protein [Alphaproteobacteria bacterium]|nr:enoyl-CoA hydratase/isomerase family protein [Alphaproteobacteria bacterium]